MSGYILKLSTDEINLIQSTLAILAPSKGQQMRQADRLFDKIKRFTNLEGTEDLVCQAISTVLINSGR